MADKPLVKWKNKELEDFIKKYNKEVPYTDDGYLIRQEAEDLVDKLLKKEVYVKDLEKKTKKEKEKKFKIIIHNKEGADEPPFVYVGYNRQSYQIPYEVECNIPEGVLNILKDAVYTRFYKDEKEEWHQKDIRRFNFSILGEV